MILRSGVLGIFIIRSLTAKNKKHLYGAVYANSRARDESEINKVSIVEPPALLVVRQLPEIPVAWLDEHTNNGAVTTEHRLVSLASFRKTPRLLREESQRSFCCGCRCAL